jgi:hypothetical protein
MNRRATAFVDWLRHTHGSYSHRDAAHVLIDIRDLREFLLWLDSRTADQPNVVRPGHECLCMNCGQTHDDGDPSRTGTADQQSEVPK